MLYMMQWDISVKKALLTCYQKKLCINISSNFFIPILQYVILRNTAEIQKKLVTWVFFKEQDVENKLLSLC